MKTRRARILAIARTSRRSGPLAWEVADLFTRRDAADEAWDVLEQLSIPAGKAGALRLFVRIPSSSPCFEQARRAGYVPISSETVYRVDDAQAALSRLGDPTESLSLRARRPEDMQGLFRLYFAATPLTVRTQTGQTMREWSDSLERPPARSRDWVLEDNDGSITAWVRTAEAKAGRWFSVTWDREAASHLPGLVSTGMSDLEPGHSAVTNVAQHAEPLAALLEEIGFEAIGTYDVLVRTLAERVPQASGAVVATG